MKTHPPPYDEKDRKILEEIPKHYGLFNYSRYQSFLDVGCHIGGWSHFVLQNVPEAHIWALDIDQTNVTLSRQNLPETNVVVSLAHCSYQTGGDFVVYQWNQNMGAGTVVEREGNIPDRATLREIEAPRMTLEDLIPVGGVDVIKIDVEGSEYDILKNCENSTLEWCQVLIGEYHFGVQRFERELLPRLGKFFRLKHLDRSEHRGRFWFEK